MAQGPTNLIHKDTGDGTILVLPWNYSSITQGTWTFGISTAYQFNGYWYNSTNALNDQIDYKMWLPKGSYVVGFFGLQLNYAYVGILLDSVLVTAMDMFAATLGHNFYEAWPDPLIVTATGIHTVSFKMIGSGTAGATYYFLYEALIIQRAN